MFKFAHIGLYLWTWVAIMNPHKLVYGIARGQSFNLWIAVITIGVWLFSRERKIPSTTGFAVLIGVFAVWFTLTTAFSPTSNMSWPLWEMNIKTMLLVYLALCILNSRIRVHAFLWIYIISIGYWGVNSGLVAIGSAGNAVIIGPAGSMITDRNALALAIAISIPIANYLRLQSTHRLIRLALVGVMLLSVAGVIGTYSRGGLISLSAMAVFLWWRSRYKIPTLIIAAVTVFFVIDALPDRYVNRVSTIATADQDASFQGRVDAWEVALQTAMDRPLGTGFAGPEQPSNWYKYMTREPKAAHSIYFMVLGEHGFIGLIIYLSILAVAWFSLSNVIKMCKKIEKDDFWGIQLATALKCSILTFAVGGAALSVSYYDGFLLLVAVSVLVGGIVKSENVDLAHANARLPMISGKNAFSPPRPAW